MRPDAHKAMLATLDRGPEALPPALFEGPVDRVLLGLKARANTIRHTRIVALEETFPETRRLIGAEYFHAIAEQHLPHAVDRPVNRIGERFPEMLEGVERDLARLEWAWLEAHGAADAPAFDLEAVATLSPEALLRVETALHPAVRCLDGAWDGLSFRGEPLAGRYVLITRPDAKVLVAPVNPSIAELVRLLSATASMAALLDTNADATVALIRAGALTLGE